MNIPAPSIEFITNVLVQKDIRPSYQRIKVLEYLHRAKSHPTADEIFHALSPGIPSLSKVTIYNTVHTFVEAGLVRAVDIDETKMRYDITLSKHGHFLCETCGKIFDLKVDIENISIAGLEKFHVKEKNLYFKGQCPNCQKQTR